MTDEELTTCKPGDTLYASKGDRVVRVKLLLVRNGDPVCEFDGKFSWHTLSDLYRTRAAALLAFAADKRKSATSYRKAAQDNHDKAVEAEALAMTALADAARELRALT